MKSSLTEDWNLIRSCPDNPTQLESHDGIATAVALSESILRAAEDAALHRNQTVLRKLAPLLPRVFNRHQPNMYFLEIHEYIWLLDDTVEADEDPIQNSYLSAYRNDIAQALDRIKSSLS
jgi:hypothetical protein